MNLNFKTIITKITIYVTTINYFYRRQNYNYNFQDSKRQIQIQMSFLVF